MTWIALTDPKAALQTYVERLQAKGEFVWRTGQPLDKLTFKLMGDKGGDITSILLMCNNLIKNNSPARALCVGMYQGFPEDAAVIELAFGKQIRALMGLAEMELKLSPPTTKAVLPNLCTRPCYICKANATSTFQLKCCITTSTHVG